ncbi:MAG: magnesium-translocating P-type ATPase [Gemmatimonadaceae bacterium]
MRPSSTVRVTDPRAGCRPASASLEAPPASAGGLSWKEAADRLARHGPNSLTRTRRVGAGRQLLSTLTTPLMLILLAASGVAAAVGELTDATIIVVTVLLGAALDAFQTSRSNTAVERLQRSVVPTATVSRDGEWWEVPRRLLVPGDVIHLSAGDVVPADARLVAGRDLHVQQAALTGESLPVEKEAARAERNTGADVPLRDPNVRDAIFLGTSIVSGVGIAVVLATGSQTAFGEIAARLREAPPPTELERGLRRFGALLAKTVVFLVLFLVLVSVAMHRDPLESLLFAVALAVGVVPEFMPMVTSITLATGAVRMARKQVIVKHLAAIHNFGSIDILCSDKTGTLTSGAMQLVSATDPRGADDARVSALAGIAAHLQTGIQNPLDDAIRSSVPAPADCQKLDEVPFDFERRRMSVVARRSSGVIMIVKGAPEGVLAACTRARAGDDTSALDAAERDRVLARLKEAGTHGLRTLAIASRPLDQRDRYERADERDLTFEGWLSFADPPLPDAAAAVASLASDGVQLKILTGDDPTVARHVCAATGIDVSDVMSGEDLDRVSDAALGPVAERTPIFARVSPQQKLRIILALKSRGHVVGYIGDGINDAPSLHAADVGISVASAVDVAKDAADVVLLDRGLAVLHTGIIEGRKAFGNVMKYLLMGTSSNFGNMFSMAVASLIVPFLPMLPTQILLNNFLYDLSQIAIPSDHVDDAYIRKPHHWDIRGLRRFMVRIGLVSSAFDILTFAALLLFFRATPPVFRTGWFVESLATQTLVLFVIRTSGNPLRNRPSPLLATTVAATLVIGIAIPYSPLRTMLGFVPPPAEFVLFVVVATIAYLAAVELAKRTILPALMT